MARILSLMLQEKVLVAVLVSYQLLAGVLREYTFIDLMIPCLFKTFFHLECWGCGLSSAAIELLHFRWSMAAEKNPIIYAVSILIAVRIYSKSASRLFDKRTPKQKF